MRAPLAIFFAALLAYALTAGGHLYSPDEEILFRTARALAFDHSLAIEPLEGFATRAPKPPRADGKEYAQYGIGQPLDAAAVVWLGSKCTGLASDATWQRIYGAADLKDRLGFKPVAAELAPRFFVSWYNILVGALLAMFVYLLCLEILGDARASAWAAALYAFGTLAWPHSRPFFTESLATLCIVIAWWAVLRGLRGRTVAWMLLAGFFAGYAALVRMDSALAYPALAVLILGPVVDAARTRRVPVGAAWAGFAVPAALCGCVILFLNWKLFGGMTKTGYASQPEGVAFATPILVGLTGFLFSVGKGIFFFSPPLLLGLWGWGAMRRGERKLAWPIIAALATAILVPLLIQSTWLNWPGGWCWGPRHIFLIHPFLIVPVAAWLAGDWAQWKRIVAIVMLVVGAGVQLLGCSEDFITFHQRFFRSPGDVTAFNIFYDAYDEGFWRQHFDVIYHDAKTGQFKTLPQLILPAPIQDSVYHPQRSVWKGYPQMLREGIIDNIWLRLFAPDAQSSEEPRS